MNPLNQVNIEETATKYDVSLTYHSDIKCENYEAKITGVELPLGKVTILPSGTFFPNDGFKFVESDPDRVIAIAQMMLSFAQMVKNNNKKLLTQPQTNDNISI